MLLSDTAYPNSEEGVRALLAAESDGLVPVRFKADPYVDGAWLVECKLNDGQRFAVLCYTAPHPYAGQFEVGDEQALKDNPSNDAEVWWEDYYRGR